MFSGYAALLLCLSPHLPSGTFAEILGDGFCYSQILKPIDSTSVLLYNMDKLSNLSNREGRVTTRTISSTTAQNHFGQILDDVIQNHTRY
ncbi:MAG: hypothetical protein JXA14_11675, partial [Anaerolineae bacterium]|nr:hypothetical protein [Anaerolineae bacterium]